MGYGLKPKAIIAWARVTVLLSLDEVDEATTEAIRASKATGNWDRFGDWWRLGGPMVYPTQHMPVGWVWFEPGRHARMLINDEVLAEYAFAGTIRRLGNGLWDTMSEPGFRRYDLDAWELLREDQPSGQGGLL